MIWSLPAVASSFPHGENFIIQMIEFELEVFVLVVLVELRICIILSLSNSCEPLFERDVLYLTVLDASFIIASSESESLLSWSCCNTFLKIYFFIIDFFFIGIGIFLKQSYKLKFLIICYAEKK